MWFKYELKAQKLLEAVRPGLGASALSGRVGRNFSIVFKRKRQFLTKLPLSLVFHKQKCIKTAYL